jgi:oxygen-independent coproporphyrinogen-3 oxidase
MPCGNHQRIGSIIPDALVAKYNIPVPRYTSYPPASVWGPIDEEDFRTALSQRAPSDPLSLYVHIPFCQSICAYCGCLSIPNRQPEVEESYVKALLREISLIAPLTGRARVNQLHFGGGTPTKLTLCQLAAIATALKTAFAFDDDAEVSMEIDPRTVAKTEAPILDNLKALGITRVSLGIQDLNEQVQEAIGRRQSERVSREVMQHCRSLGFSGVNFDLIYGLPCQTVESFQATIDKVLTLRPDRIALFSFAFLPSIRANQRSLSHHLLPTPEAKFRMFFNAREHLTRHGYVAIGLDHFALPEDPLSHSLKAGTLHRNFQGYTNHEGDEVLALGMTSISALQAGYFQNAKTLPEYLTAITEGRLATCRGVHLTPDDCKRRYVIEQIMCRGLCKKADFECQWLESFDGYFQSSLERMLPLARDGLVELTDSEIVVTNTGRLFLRPIAACFDATLPSTASQAI